MLPTALADSDCVTCVVCEGASETDFEVLVVAGCVVGVVARE